MKPYQRSSDLIKIIEGMDLVYKRLLIEKRKINGKLVVIRNNKIVKIDP